MTLIVRRPYPSIDAWLREEAHLFSAERAWLVGVDAPPGTTAHVTIGLKGDDPILEADVFVDGVAGDFRGQPLLAVRWVDLDAGARETLESLLHVDLRAIAPAEELPLPPMSSVVAGLAAPDSDPNLHPNPHAKPHEHAAQGWPSSGFAALESAAGAALPAPTSEVAAPAVIRGLDSNPTPSSIVDVVDSGSIAFASTAAVASSPDPLPVNAARSAGTAGESDPLDRLRTRPVGTETARAIAARGRAIRSRGTSAE